MSWLENDYPAPRYHGDEGEISAVFRPSDTPSDLTTPTGGRTDYLATKSSTNGDFGLYHVHMTAEAQGTSPHFHKAMSESFYILNGSLRVFDGERWFDANQGDFLYVPPGGLHSFGNESGEPVDFLMLFAPGAAREGYFEGIAHLASMTDEERAAFFVHHDSYFVDMAKGPAAAKWETRKSFKTR
ncbi:Mannose-6-phosphate isomerase, cupin superfamily [Streptoalloteichus tenebrarius]|uniref:Mannose-6-phosphate isomerase, cupin superfamily n=1 Tax=Streptoalloteichus tenebrarius (strain ATCC 17920 / DSM 40477 / JCM 4838 / CBS 697.72 / NBRC 16177 / NCIMB 11028 / NRRL B-12390 / A12253. 1 / ISP 5477) TaxID=1933 RepID=A0ABT1HMT0_STRSD|nr:cupin domain-containing protein [Streptoalloteichus tenebrarius]MCP2256815.1 Mannose-6-phosphate isomerase, cupin superfamily [Streptoalloteichus tenebrarius]BFF00277.1 cupin domain-containing protein [Streptoalloteichus tenebrarius]